MRAEFEAQREKQRNVVLQAELEAAGQWFCLDKGSQDRYHHCLLIVLATHHPCPILVVAKGQAIHALEMALAENEGHKVRVHAIQKRLTMNQNSRFDDQAKLLGK